MPLKDRMNKTVFSVFLTDQRYRLAHQVTSHHALCSCKYYIMTILLLMFAGYLVSSGKVSKSKDGCICNRASRRWEW